jgi:predicted nucleic acid-binding protein
MKIRTAYLDTCSIGELLLPKTAVNRISMDRIIELARKRLLTLFTSEECWIELNDSPKRYVSDLKKKYNSIPRVELKENIGVSSLIDAYTQPRVLDQPDATHLAYATFYKIDVLLTYNRRTIIKNSRKISRGC